MSIAEYIRTDLEVRLRSGRELPKQLTIDSLAGMYNVSFTPVRSAIAGLIDDGLLTKGPNRRLVVSVQPGSNGNESIPAERPEPPRDPYPEIVSDLIQASLRGKPISLREEVTAEKYAVGRSVIRNIFHRLAGEGILDHIPRRGWRLRAFRQDDLKSYIEIRELLELKALDLAFPKLDGARLKSMLEANVFPTTAEEAPRIDESLHSYLIELSGNAYIKDFFARQGRYYALLFSWEDRDRKAALETVSQHHEILTGLLKRDLKTAQAALSYHILNNHPILSQIVAPGAAE